MSQRTVIVGGPRTGKSTLARELRAQGHPTFCGDPISLVKEPEAGVTYLPDGLGWSGSSAYVAEHWLSAPGPWVCEGVVMARALRKFAGALPDRIIVLANHCPLTPVADGQATMHRGVMTVWREIAARFAPVAEVWAWRLGRPEALAGGGEKATALLCRIDREQVGAVTSAAPEAREAVAA